MTVSVLVARLDSAGDVLLAGPAVRAIRAGADRVVMLVSPHGQAAAELLIGVDEVLVWECPWITTPAPAVTSENVTRLVHQLGSLGLAAAVVLTSFHQSPLPLALLLRLAGVARITAASIDYPGSLLDTRLRPGEPGPDGIPEDLPEPERALAIAAAAGFRLPPGDTGRLAIRPVPPATPALVGPGRYVVAHPGARAPARRWPATQWQAAVAALVATGHRVVLTGTDQETALTRQVAGQLFGSQAVRDLAGRTTLAELAGVLASADALVVGNTGPAHLAAAVGTPVVSLFAPVVPALRWAPYQVPHRLLGDQTAPCRNTRARTCPLPGHPCLTHISPHDVVTAVHQLITPEAPT